MLITARPPQCIGPRRVAASRSRPIAVLLATRHCTGLGPQAHPRQRRARTRNKRQEMKVPHTFWRVIGLLCLWCLASGVKDVYAVIVFRNSASAGAASGNLTINKPAGTVQADVMVASISVRPETTTDAKMRPW